VKTWEVAEAVLAEAPRNSLALSAIGAMHWQQGEFSAARRFYEQAIDSDPGDETSALFLAAQLRALCDYPGARRVLFEALAHNPTAPDLHRAIAEILIMMDDFATANEHARIFAEYDPAVGGLMVARLARFVTDEASARSIIRAYNSKEAKQTLEPVDELSLDAVVNPAARDAYIETQRNAPGVGDQNVLRYIGANDVADDLLRRESREGELVYRQPVMLVFIWMDGAENFRRSPEFKGLVDHWNMHDYWRDYGYPPQCLDPAEGALCAPIK